MTWCTFSSDDYRCDVWATTQIDRFQIVMAKDRIVGDIPRADHLDEPETEEAYKVAWRKQREFIENAVREPIDHPDANMTFWSSEFPEFAAKMQQLHNDGFRIPDEVMAELKTPDPVP